MAKKNSSAGCPNTIGVTCSRSLINYRMGPFWENQFFVFWRDPKNFFEPPKPYFALESSLLGGSSFYLKLFDPSNGFEVIDFKIGIFWKNYLLNQGLDQKVWSMTPPKVRFLRPDKVLGGPKRFWGPKKHKKLIFSKNLNSAICPYVVSKVALATAV